MPSDISLPSLMECASLQVLKPAVVEIRDPSASVPWLAFTYGPLAWWMSADALSHEGGARSLVVTVRGFHHTRGVAVETLQLGPLQL